MLILYAHVGEFWQAGNMFFPSGLKFSKGSWLCCRLWPIVTGTHLLNQALEDQTKYGFTGSHQL